MQVPESAIKYRHEHQSGKLCPWLVDGKHETFDVGVMLRWKNGIYVQFGCLFLLSDTFNN